MRIFKSHPLLSLVYGYLVDSSKLSNISYLWNFGSLLGFCLVIQIITGVTLVMHYNPSVFEAFNSVEHIMRDVNNGWLIRYLHSNNGFYLLQLVGTFFLFLLLGLYLSRLHLSLEDLIYNNASLTLIFGFAWHGTGIYFSNTCNSELLLFLPFIKVSLYYLWLNAWHYYLYGRMLSLSTFTAYLLGFLLLAVTISSVILYSLVCINPYFVLDICSYFSFNIFTFNIIDGANHAMSDYQAKEFVKGIRRAGDLAVASHLTKNFYELTSFAIEHKLVYSTAHHHMARVMRDFSLPITTSAVGLDPTNHDRGFIKYPALTRLFGD